MFIKATKPYQKILNIATIIIILALFLFGLISIINKNFNPFELKGRVLGIFTQATVELHEGDIFRTYNDPAVYYVGPKNQRHLFVNRITFDTWFDDFSGLKYIDQSVMDNLPVGQNITVKPGTKLITFPNTKKVFAVTPGPILQEVVPSSGDTTLVTKLYGNDYQRLIITIQNGFENNYGDLGPALTNNSKLPNGSLIRYHNDENIYYIDSGRKMLITPEAFSLNAMHIKNIRSISPIMEYISGGNITTKVYGLSAMLNGYDKAKSKSNVVTGDLSSGLDERSNNIGSDIATSTPTTKNCMLSAAYWTTSTTVKDTGVTLTVLSTNCANNTVITYIIKQKKALLGINWLWPDSVIHTIQNNKFSTTWVAGQKQDSTSSIGDYYFVATANNVSIESNILSVTQTITATPVCGNSIMEIGEQCDDGNAFNGDSCSSSCQSKVAVNYTNSITQYGITWTFNGQYQYGKFINGDYWVKGPVTISSITPNFDGNHHGWMVNMSSTAQGYESRAKNFKATLVPLLPYVAKGGESIVKAISTEPLNTSCRTCLKTAAVLTIVSTIPENNGATVFRPSYFGTDKTIYSIGDVNMSLLPSLTPPPGYELAKFSWITERFKRLQLDVSSYPGEDIRPYENMCIGGLTQGGCSYGGNIALNNGDFALRLMLNDSLDSKREHLIYYVQHGIDLYYTMLGGMNWHADGGHGNGRKLPIVLTAILLENNTWKKNILAEPKNTFQEDDFLTFSQPANNGLGQVLFGVGGSYWINAATDTSSRVSIDPYGYVDGGPLPGTSYQKSINSMIWKGTALAGVIMPEVANVWNSTNLLTYVDRWVNFGAWAQPDVCAPVMGVCVGGINNGSTCTYADVGACAGGYCAAGICTGGIDPGQLCGFGLGSTSQNNCINGNQCRGLNPAYYGVTYGPDPHDSSKCIKDTNLSDGIGRFPFRHGQDANTGVYSSGFVNAMWNSYRGLSASTFVECTVNSNCNDGLYCNGTETCSSGTCISGTAPCSADNYSCTVTSCNESTDVCSIVYDNAVCNTNNVCTNDVCVGAGGDINTGCQITNNSMTCNDGNSCTSNDVCSLGRCAGTTSCTASALSSGLAAYYPFDGNANDASGNGNNGTVTGNASLTTGIYGQGYAFDGLSSRINVGSNPSLDNLSSVTYSAWINIQGYSKNGHGFLVDKNYINLSWHHGGGGYHNDVISGAVSYSDTNSMATSQNLYSKINNTWTHVVMTFDAISKNVSLYINGVEATYQVKTTGVGTKINDAVSVQYIGDSSYGTRTFNGSIDEVRIYNRALTATEVLELYNIDIIVYSSQPTTVNYFGRYFISAL